MNVGRYLRGEDRHVGTARTRRERTVRESDIEAYLIKRAKAAGGAVRKVQWIGRRNAPDRVLMLPDRGARLGPYEEGSHYLGPARKAATIWVEVKRPDTIKTFPANAHERAQHREHQLMRAMGQRVEVVGTFEQVHELFT